MSTIVIGAGLAGLAAARRLHDAGEDVIVLEAQGFIGGRTRTDREHLLNGQTADLGGSLIDLGQDRILAACAEYGLRLTPTMRFVDPDPDGRYSVASILQGPTVTEGRALSAEERARTAAEVRSALAAHPPAETESVAGWAARASLTPLARRLVHAQAGLNPVHEAIETPMAAVKDAATGRVCWMLADGADSLATALADGLDVRLGQPARLVRQDQTTFEITVVTDTDEFQATDVIIATPVTPTSCIAFDPPLPDWKIRALVTTPMSQGGKIVGQYADGAGLRAKFGSHVLSDGPISFAWCGPVGEQNTVVVYGVAPDLSDGFLRDEQRALAALDSLVSTAVGSDVERLAGLVEDWTRDEWAGGVVSNILAAGPGQAAVLARSAGWGMIHFAGEHTAEKWVSSMEGALRSGDRAADEILLQRALAPTP